MKTIKENPFTYFREIKRIEMNFGSMCKLHNDNFVSYCRTTSEPLCVKCILIYSRKETPMDIVSLSELQESLFKDIQQKYNIVQGQIKNIEKIKLKDYDEDELKVLKQKGLRKLQETKEQIIQKIHEIFTFMKTQWNQLFDENFNIKKKRNDIVHELQLLTKIFIRTLKQNQNIQNQPELHDLKELIETNSMVKNTDFISKRVRQLIQNLQKLQTVNRYPEMTTNSLIISKVYEELKYMFDYNIDYSIKKQDMKKVFKFKFLDFYKSKNQINGKALKNQIEKYENNHKFVPIIAKNRRLMVYDISVPNFKELMLSEIHSIPISNCIAISQQQTNRIFIIGGHLFKNPQNKVFEFDTSTQEFRIHPSMNQERWLHQATPYKDYIYVTGGTDSEKEIGLSSVERYDIVNEVWEKLSDMKNPRHSHCAVLCTNMDKNQSHNTSAYIYVFGGIGTNNRYMNTIEKYDIERNSWSEIVFQNSFNLDLVRPFGIQINNQEILLFGGFKYYQSKDSITNDFILYPFNNQEVFTFSIEDDILSCSDYYNLPLGVQACGNQIIQHQKQIYFVGNLNTTTFYNHIQKAEYTENINAKKVICKISQNKIQIIDFVLFQ